MSEKLGKEEHRETEAARALRVQVPACSPLHQLEEKSL